MEEMPFWIPSWVKGWFPLASSCLWTENTPDLWSSSSQLLSVSSLARVSEEYLDRWVDLCFISAPDLVINCDGTKTGGRQVVIMMSAWEQTVTQASGDNFCNHLEGDLTVLFLGSCSWAIKLSKEKVLFCYGLTVSQAFRISTEKKNGKTYKKEITRYTQHKAGDPSRGCLNFKSNMSGKKQKERPSTPSVLWTSMDAYHIVFQI